jgi:ubiquinone/menaquinone biosynthesis C-methylase UbiE
MGVDTSAEMVDMANFLVRHLSFIKKLLPLIEKEKRVVKMDDVHSPLTFARGNAEDTKLPENSFDLITIMYAFHEAPKLGRAKILTEARRLLRPEGTLAIVDITACYKPSKSMLEGEPYVLEYQRNIHTQLADFMGFAASEYKTVVPGQVGMWLLKRAPEAAR